MSEVIVISEEKLEKLKAELAKNLKEFKKVDSEFKAMKQEMENAKKELQTYKDKDLEKIFSKQFLEIWKKYKKGFYSKS
jgi:chromosome segregation ATPase